MMDFKKGFVYHRRWLYVCVVCVLIMSGFAVWLIVKLQPGEDILFRSNREGDYKLYLMNDDGSHQTLMAPDPQAKINYGVADALGVWYRELGYRPVKWVTQASWSPDGTKFLFVGEPPLYSIRVLSVEGEKSYGGWGTVKLSWAPDGSQLASIAYGAPNILEDHGGSRRLLVGETEFDARKCDIDAPTFSPTNSNHLVVTVQCDCKNHRCSELYLIDPVTDTNIQLFPEKVVTYPIWSPDGSSFIFTGNSESEDIVSGEIYHINLDGTDLKQLTYTNSHHDDLVWAPDGTRLAFTSTRDGNSEIYIMSADGSDQRRLTFSPSVDDHPTWSSNGSQIAFASNRGGHFHIYRINIDGTDLTQLTLGAWDDIEPMWRP